VPTATILGVVRTRPGQPFDERLVREDLQNIFDLGYFSDQVPPLIRQRPDGIAITYRVIENPVIERIAVQRQRPRAVRYAARADGHGRRASAQHEHVPSRRAQDQLVLRQDRLQRPGADARREPQRVGKTGRSACRFARGLPSRRSRSPATRCSSRASSMRRSRSRRAAVFGRFARQGLRSAQEAVRKVRPAVRRLRRPASIRRRSTCRRARPTSSTAFTWRSSARFRSPATPRPRTS
jgi:hypothetical protein